MPWRRLDGSVVGGLAGAVSHGVLLDLAAGVGGDLLLDVAKRVAQVGHGGEPLLRVCRAVSPAPAGVVEESFRRRGIPAPVFGWILGLVPPWEPWTDHIAPDVAARVQADLAEHPPTAAVAVVVALDLSGRSRQFP